MLTRLPVLILKQFRLRRPATPRATCTVHDARHLYNDASSGESRADVTALRESIESAGTAVRELKAGRADKQLIQEAVKKLLNLKSKLVEIEGATLGTSDNTGNAEKPKLESSSTLDQAPNSNRVSPVDMETLVTLCKTKGFIFPSSEIYSSFPGFFDYGPLGVELKNNIKKAWWKEFVQRREDVVGLDSSIICHPAVWEASGHVAGFSDPMVDCKATKFRYRADQVYWGKLVPINPATQAIYVSVLEGDNMQHLAYEAALAKAKASNIVGPFHPMAPVQDLLTANTDEYSLIPSPGSGKAGDLTRPRDFNLMFQTRVGAASDASSVAYLRPETAQGIFTNFVNVQRTSRLKIPFGIAQIGKAFRNEITPRNFIFRCREFEQLELEYFISDHEQEWKLHHQQWVDCSWRWLTSMGVREDWLKLDVKAADSGLAHYARACTDITFRFPFGTQELMGIAARGNYDLTRHAEHSGVKLDYFDASEGQGQGRHYVPHVIEPSAGVDRVMLAVLTSAYREETIQASTSARSAEKRVVLGLLPSLAPIKVAVFPLVSNKPELLAAAKLIYKRLRQHFVCEFDISGAIGRRYRRADEIGTPFCVTVDFTTLQDETVTVRERDSMRQTRMDVKDLRAYLYREIDGCDDL